jgi:hypothetical protein
MKNKISNFRRKKTEDGYLINSVEDPDHFGKLDPDSHQSGKLDPDPDPHQSEKEEASEGHFRALKGPTLEKS